MSILLSILLFLGVLFILILVHEWGHYIVAKWTKMRVDEFGIGFPPKLFSVKKGETEYSFNALPVGGFVRIYGEDPTQVGVEDAELDRAFNRRPKWAQALVLIAGVSMNVIFAWFLFVIILMVGIPTAVSEEEAGAGATLFISEILAGSPADGVVAPGVTVVAVSAGAAELENLTPSAFSQFVSENSGETLSLTYLQNNNEETVSLTPQSGLVPGDEQRVVVGVALSMVETVRQPFFTALYNAIFQTIDTTKAIVVGLGSLLAGTVAGTADFSQVAGPVGIVSYVSDAAAYGFTSLLLFTAVISLNLAVINLLPVPALDGGRLVFVAIEVITRKEINPIWAGRANFIGFALLMLLMLLVTVNDVVRLW